MIKTAKFLDKYSIVLFDMDGVMTSEQRYWDAAALTVYEHLNTDVSPDRAMSDKEKIRSSIFCNDKTLLYLKNAGVNSNWDTTYVVLSAALMLGTKDDFSAVYEYIKGFNLNAPELYDFIGEKSPLGKRGSEAYNRCVLTFQEWYLGDKLFEEKWYAKPRLKGKKGLLWYEEPVVPLHSIVNVLKTLSESGISLGIGTGRVDFELMHTLEKWDLTKYFDENRIITYTEVLHAEEKTGEQPLTKPNPYTFLKGMLGKSFDDNDIINSHYDKAAAEKTLVVGDAGSDILSAQAASMDFAAVLTGVSGQKAKDYFIKQGATYILNDINGLIEGIETGKNGKNKSCGAFVENVCS